MWPVLREMQVGLLMCRQTMQATDLYTESEKNTSDAAVRARGISDGNISGISWVQANHGSYDLYTESEKNTSDAAVRAREYPMEISVESRGAGKPWSYDLYTESEKNTSDAAVRARGISDGNVSGIAWVQANHTSYNLFTESEMNASQEDAFSRGFSDGNTSAWENGIAEWNAHDSNQTEGLSALITDAWNRGVENGKQEIKLKMAREALSVVTLHSSAKTPTLYTGDWYYMKELGWLWSEELVFPFLFSVCR